jgi:hypothetical protein
MININKTIADLQEYANTLDSTECFAIFVNPNWHSPELVYNTGVYSLKSTLVDALESDGYKFTEVNSHNADDPEIYEKTLNPSKEDKKTSEYETIVLKGIEYNLVPRN